MSDLRSGTAVPKENKMGVQPVAPLLFNMALPMMAGMLVQALYNIVDSIFVSHMNEAALTAVSLAFPIQTLMIAVSVGTGIGVNAVVSKSLGEKNFEQANRTASNGIFLAVCSTLLFMAFGLFASGPFFRTQTTDETIVTYGIHYLFVVCVFSQGLFLQIMMEKLLCSTGKTFDSMMLQIVGAIVNLILDPILIFGLCGMPKLGVAGAGIATVAGQWAAAGIGLWLHITRNRELIVTLSAMKPHLPTIERIYAIGVPSIAMQAVGSVTVFFMNKILLGFTSTAAAVFGVYFKLQSFVLMPVFGLNNGMVPIVSYNFGARRPDRMVQTIKFSLLYGTGITVTGFLLFELVPAWLLGLFDASADMLAIGVPALRILGTCFLLAGINIVCSAVFQALGHGVLSLWASIGRQLLAMLPLAYVFSLSGDINMVWMSYPCAELVAITMTVLFMLKVHKTSIKPLYETAPAVVLDD